MSFPRYPNYKSTGADVLSQLPEHWDLRPLRQLGRLFKGSGGSKEDIAERGVPCVRYGDLYTTHSFFVEEARTFLTAEKAQDYTPIRYADVLFAASGEKLEEIGKAAVNLIKDGAFCGGDLIILRPTVPVWPRFIGYAADSLPSNLQKASMGRGTTVKHIYPDELRHLLVAVPTVPEQQAIAAFLDRETAKIDALVAEQERLIELLREKRQAVISHAITKGLNPDVRMKDTGVEWLGKVPAHWRFSRIRTLFRQAKRQEQSGMPVLSVYREYGVILKDSRDDNINKTPDDISAYQLVMPGDLVVNKMKAWQGSLGISSLQGVTSPDYVVFIPRHVECANFLHVLLRCRQVVSVYRSISNGIRPDQWRLEPDRFLNLPIFLPPESEQRELVATLGDLSKRHDDLAARAQHAIDLLQERRTALISAAVTGQIDVRPDSMRTAA